MKTKKPRSSIRKRSKITPYKKLWKLAEDAAKKAIQRRDGVCVVHNGKCKPGSRFVMEHCISRSNKSIFFDERNLNWTCQGVNYGKAMGNRHLILLVEEIVDKKWGEGTVEELRRLSRIAKKPTVIDLENLAKSFDEMYL